MGAETQKPLGLGLDLHRIGYIFFVFVMGGEMGTMGGLEIPAI